MVPKLCRRCPGVLLRSSDQLDAHDAQHAIRDARAARETKQVIYSYEVRFDDFETYEARRDLEARR